MLSDNVYLDLADYIYFSKNKSLEGLNNKLNELGLEFRKNKGIKDINKAIEKARNPKNGHYRTEMEVDYLALCLKIDIVKQKAKYKVGDKVKIVDYPPEGSGFEICNNSLTMSEACSKIGVHFNTFSKRAKQLECYHPN